MPLQIPRPPPNLEPKLQNYLNALAFELERFSRENLEVRSQALGGTGLAGGLTAGSVIFQGAAAAVAQDNSNLFWDDTNNVLQAGGFTGPSASPVYRLDTSGFSFGSGNSAAPSGNPLQIVNTYTGAALSDNAIAVYGLTDYRPTGTDSSNSAGVYGILWIDSPQTFNGLPAAVKGNSYAIAQITATIAGGGSNNAVGDTLSVTGGTCTNALNTPPTFNVTAVSSGAVTAVAFNRGTGSCGTYPANPVSTTSSNGGATPPTLTLTISATPTISDLAGLYGRVRNQSSGTITNAYGIFVDGLYNTGQGGVVTNSYGAFIKPAYTTGNTSPVNDYGLYFSGDFLTGSIAAAAGKHITVTTSGGGLFKLNTAPQFSAFGSGHLKTDGSGNVTSAALAHADLTDFIAITADTPTVTAGTNTFTSVAGAQNVTKFGKTVFVIGSVTITTNGTAATSIIVTLPPTATFGSRTGSAEGTGRGSDAKAWVGGAAGSSPGTMIFTQYDGTYGGAADGFVLTFSYFYFTS